MKVIPEAKNQTAVYCQGAGAVVEVDGVLSKGDKYGESYRRPCLRAADCDGVVCRTTS